MQLVSTLAHEKCLWPVPPGRDENPVRVFATFTEDLERLTDWLEQCGVTTVSAGIHWSLLDSTVRDSRTTSIRPCLVNARHMKNVPGLRAPTGTNANFNSHACHLGPSARESS